MRRNGNLITEIERVSQILLGYKQQEQKAIVYPLGDKSLRLEFAQQQRAVAPGQAVVLYQGDVVVAGGTITQVLR